MTAIYVPPGGPPQDGPSREIYALMGREQIFRMLEDVYRELEKSNIRHMFPENMAAASQRSAAFFVGIMGGPPLYQDLYGPPMMRRRHLVIPIDEAARRTWLDCFLRVLDNAEEAYGFPAEHLPGFVKYLESFSAWMVNRE